jgi:transposase-like protein
MVGHCCSHNAALIDRITSDCSIGRVFGPLAARCRVHWVRNALAYVPKTQQNMVAGALRQAFLQPDRAQASQMLRHVADQLRPK